MLLKKPYEISLWEKVPTYIVTEGVGGAPYETPTIPVLENINIINQYDKEVCLAVVGSDTMDTPIKAFNPKLKQNLNGTNTLTFEIYYKYLDDDGEYKENPFTNLLVNERVIKLKYNQKWYSFVIKNITKDNKTYTYTYLCNDLYVNELSKIGYNIEFNTELRNNQGTIGYLTKEILKESDWVYDENSEVIKQTNKESLYTYKLQAPLQAKCLDRFTFNKHKYPELENTPAAADGVVEKNTIYSIPAGETIYICYSSIANKENPVQFFYYPDEKYALDAVSGVILNSPNWSGVINNIPYESLKITTDFFGEKLIALPKSAYLEEIDSICEVYEKGGEQYYCLVETEYPSAASITNLLLNNTNFVTTNGWSGVDGSTVSLGATNEAQSTLKINFGSNGRVVNNGIYSHRRLTNGFTKGEQYIFAIKADNNTRISGALISDTGSTEYFTFLQTSNPNEVVSGYKTFKGTCIKSLSYTEMLKRNVDFYLKGNGIVNLIDGKLFKMAKGSNGKIIIPDLETDINSVITSKCQFFKTSSIFSSIDDLEFEFTCSASEIAAAGFVPVFSENYEKIRSITASKSNRYNLIQELCETFECWAQFNIEYDSKGVVKHEYVITEDTAAEEGKTYYSKLGVGSENKHTNYKKIAFAAGAYERKYKKTVLFKPFIGQENFVGFRYGINVNSIKRDVKSEQIVTKLIVEPNSNEFAPNGSCTIQDSILNPTGETTLYNFDYYIGQKLINKENLYEDLYGSGLGYYSKLRTWNDLIKQNSIKIAKIKGTLDKLESRKTTYGSLIAAAESNIANITEDIMAALNNATQVPFAAVDMNMESGRLKLSISGELLTWQVSDLQHPFNSTYYEKIGLSSTPVLSPSGSVTAKVDEKIAPISNSINGTSGTKNISSWAIGQHNLYCYAQTKDLNYWPAGSGTILITRVPEINNDYIRSKEAERDELLRIIESYKDIFYNTNNLILLYVTELEGLEKLITEYINKKTSLNKEFYKKYSRFIQEGTWTSEDYIDSELYFLDAQKILYTSAYPQVSYSINVTDISQVEGYEPYKFEIGDKTYVEDTEFFGWDVETGKPHQEEIVVSEVTYSLDNPAQNTITVQNYKTQFEDLFQRMAATTQSLQYYEGKYSRAAGAINPDGTIKSSILQDSMDKNALILKNATNESVTWDETGLTTVSENNPHEIVRIVGGGIMLTSDGGKKWSTGITGKGINASVVTTGRLDTDKIRIFAGDSPSFEWDGVNGISAYMMGATGDVPDRGQFVRFNKFGLFGYQGPLAGEGVVDLNNFDYVVDNSIFSLTWKGLKINIKNADENDEIININDRFIVKGNGNVTISTEDIDLSAFVTFSKLAAEPEDDDTTTIHGGYIKTKTISFSDISGTDDISAAINDAASAAATAATTAANAVTTAGNAATTAANATTIAANATTTADNAETNLNKLISGQLAGGTFINKDIIYSPNIIGGVITGGQFVVRGGAFQVQDESSTLIGKMGQMYGDDGVGPTTGVALSAGSNYIICTTSGVRMQAGGRSLYCIDRGVFMMKDGVEIPLGSTAVFG